MKAISNGNSISINMRFSIESQWWLCPDQSAQGSLTKVSLLILSSYSIVDNWIIDTYELV